MNKMNKMNDADKLVGRFVSWRGFRRHDIGEEFFRDVLTYDLLENI